MSIRHPIQYLFDLFLAAAAQAKRRLIRQNDDIFAARSRLHLSDPAEIDNRRAVDSAELFRIQLLLQLRNGVRHRIVLRLILRKEMRDLVKIHELQPASS